MHKNMYSNHIKIDTTLQNKDAYNKSEESLEY
jgi:hypothetical protein